MSSVVVTARWLVASPERCIARGGLWIERGRVRELLDGERAIERALSSPSARRIDLGSLALTPGLVNAHAHLDLTHLAGRVAPGDDFPSWIEALLRWRRSSSSAELACAVRRGADLCLASGTTTVGDVDSGADSAAALATHPMRALVYREALDAGDPERAASVLAALARPLPRRERTREGVSPHAPYTVGAELFRDLGALVHRRKLPVSVHWAETREERAWLERGEGPFARLFARSPRRSGLDLVAESGLLDSGKRRAALALVHGNDASPAERERVARSGAVLVHCPGSHRFFGRERFDARSWSRAGVELALGTDSLASNERLDLRREMALFRGEHPDFEPRAVWSMATRGGALALGLAGRVGELSPGAWADLCAWRVDARDERELFDALTNGAARLERVWIAGREPQLAVAGDPA